MPRIEVLPPDELPEPLPNQAAPLARTETGQIADSATAKALGARGGQAKAARIKLLSGLGLQTLAENSNFKPYERAGQDFIKAHLLNLAGCVGGSVGPGPASIVCTAGMQLAASRFVFDLAAAAGDPGLFHRASTLGNDSRQNLLAAYELARREGESRKAEDTGLDFHDIASTFEGDPDK